METRLRTIAKALSWQTCGLISMSAIAFAQTGSLTGAFTFAFTSAGIGFVCYFLHERAWSQVCWGRRHDAASGARSEVGDGFAGSA